MRVKQHPRRVRAQEADDHEWTVRVVDLQAYGQLEELLGDDFDTIDSLVVTGKVGHVDIDYMRKVSIYGPLSVINLENADIEGKCMPDYAFFKRDSQMSPDGAYVYPLSLRRLICPPDLKSIGKQAFYWNCLLYTSPSPRDS